MMDLSGDGVVVARHVLKHEGRTEGGAGLSFTRVFVDEVSHRHQNFQLTDQCGGGHRCLLASFKPVYIFQFGEFAQIGRVLIESSFIFPGTILE